MMNFFKKIGAVSAILGLVLGTGLSYAAVAQATTSFRVVQTPTTHLYAGISGSATSMRITPYPLDLDGNKLTMTDFGTTSSVTIDPKISNYEEIVTFTGITDNGDNTATLTGLARDLTSKYPYTTAGTGKVHGAGAIVVWGNNPQVYGRLASKENDETITGIWSFTAGKNPKYLTAPTLSGFDLVDYQSLLDISIQGAPTSTEALMGVSQLATNAQVGAGTASSTTGAPLVIPSRAATSTCQVSQFSVLVSSSTTGKLNPPCFDQSYSYNLTGTTTMATSTAASSTISTLNVTNINVFGTVSGIPATASTSVWSSSGTWTKPSGAKVVIIELWGGGGGGGANGTGAAGGGGGGAYTGQVVLASDLGSTVAVTIGTGGAVDNAGGRTCFSSSSSCGGTIYASAYGGGHGADGSSAASAAGGGGGGLTSAGSNGSGSTGGAGGGPAGASAGTANGGFTGAGGGNSGQGADSVYGGAGGAGDSNATTAANGGNSIYGGGGGASGPSGGTGGTSLHGGAGGNTGAAGSIPGGGGGNAAAGGNGEAIIVTIF